MLIVGLGNFEDKYINTRHNLGRESVAFCADKNCDTSWVYDKYIKGKYKECGNTIFFLPETYMNLSGEAVYKALEFFSFTSYEMIVVQDELDLEFGDIKIAFDRGSAGHKGIEDIIKKVGNSKFIRIRVGIRNEYVKQKNKSDFVLEQFMPDEKEKMNSVYYRVCEAIDTILKEGLDKAMTKIN